MAAVATLLSLCELYRKLARAYREWELLKNSTCSFIIVPELLELSFVKP